MSLGLSARLAGAEDVRYPLQAFPQGMIESRPAGGVFRLDIGAGVHLKNLRLKNRLMFNVSRYLPNVIRFS